MVIKITRGLPYANQWRLPNGKDMWPNLADFEVRSQLRKTKLASSQLITNLHLFMTKSYGIDTQANDIIVRWRMTGAETRALAGDGFFDVILSDPGVTDERGLRIYSDQIKLASLITAPEGLL